jgi:galactokinase
MIEVTSEAYGRVNLIGEHTDYNGGWVLPTAIPQKTVLRLKTREDNKVFASSRQSDQLSPSNGSYVLGQEKSTDTWIDYLQGVTYVLQDEGFQLSGFEVQVDSGVPIGSGLSSSAALEVSFLKALRSAYSLDMNDLHLARIGRRAENEFVGAKVGIMDQMACTLAKAGEALFLDTSTLTYEQIPLPTQKMELIVVNSGLSHQNSDGGYNQRRAECEEACRLLKINQLRDLTIKDLALLESLPDVLKRRARHVITENQRVHDAVRAIRECNFEKLGELFYQSHTSMRDDYQVSIPAIDLLVQLCSEDPNVYGARLTGGGFGGSIVAITKPGCAAGIAKKVKQSYEKQTSYKATILVP